ncbi:amino acid adenylation domain-containing protein [Advenella incenata]|uniref:Amino acid adenylation domain-containing protein n=1 Tax=Advenella incenata TaxID=267800 RepID=A0A4Q7VS09_9BURK|nr:non-ribosomal peptide synthetase [Advenella incenata]RZT99027.1 amino acid adenylation domain-containing protein [Advenella incenata]
MRCDTNSQDRIKTFAFTRQQSRFWFEHQRMEGKDNNVIFWGVQFKETVDRERLSRIVQEAFYRHQILLTRIYLNDVYQPEFRQTLSGKIDIPWFEQDKFVYPITLENLPATIGGSFNLIDERPWRIAGISTSDGDYLFFVFHHIICDETSARIITREIDAAYFQQSCLANETSPSFQIDDFSRCAAAVEEEQSQQIKEGGIDFWLNELKNVPTVLNLPCEPDLSAESTCSLHRSAIQCSAEQTESLQAFCNKYKLTVPMVLSGIFSAVLSRYIDDKTVIIGVPVSTRNQIDTLDAIGPFLNIIPLLCEVNEDKSFIELCESVKSRLIHGLDFSAIPFDEIVKKLPHEKLVNRHPIFQATVSYHDLSVLGHGSLSACTEVETWSSSISCDISLTCENRSNGLTLFLDGDLERFSPAFLNRLIEQVHVALSLCLSDPVCCLNTISYLPSKQEDELIHVLSGKERQQDTCPIMPAIAARLNEHPQKLAFSGQLQLTYQQLFHQAAIISATLLQHEVLPGDFVLVVMDDKTHPVAEVLGIMLAGAAWVPVHYAWPKKQIEQVTQKTNAKFSLGLSLSIPNVKSISEIYNTNLEKTDYVDVLPDSPIYAISTSGTTGEPKIAAIPYKGICNRFSWMTSMFGDEAPVTLKTTPYIFDSSVWQILWPLTRGGKCVLPAKTEIFDPFALAALIEREKITVIDFVPSVLNRLLPEMENSTEIKRKLQVLRWIIIGAERLPLATAIRIRNLLPQAKIINSYGPTEASIGCVFQPIDQHIQGNKVPIGSPIPNVQVAVLDKLGGLAPRGSIGELLLMGECVGIGYVGTEDQRGFISVRIPGFSHGAAYRTGDMVRWNESGQLEYITRLDRQVKLRGVRLELGAIEYELDRCPQVAGSHLQILQLPDGKETLVAFVKTFEADSFDNGSLLEMLKRSLIKAFIPEHFIAVLEFPINSSGKIDEKALSELFFNQWSALQSKKNAFEVSSVESIWSRLLSLSDPIEHDLNFFDAGGHSLLMLDLQRELNSQFHVQVSIVDLFNHPTIADQEKLVATTPI